MLHFVKALQELAPDSYNALKQRWTEWRDKGGTVPGWTHPADRTDEAYHALFPWHLLVATIRVSSDHIGKAVCLPF